MKRANYVHVWIEKSEKYKETNQLELLLDEDELSRANKFVFEDNRRDFIVAHALKRSVIAEFVQVSEPSKLRFSRSESGKPYLLDANIYFNISHSSGMTALALSAISPCSVDIESHRQIHDLALLIEKTMTIQEQQIIKDSPSQLKSFFDKWVIKEAFLKLSGVGLAQSLKTICTESELKMETQIFRGENIFFKRGESYSLAAFAEGMFNKFVLNESKATLLNN